MHIMLIFHGLVCCRATSVARGELRNIWHKMCFFTLCSCCTSLVFVVVDVLVIVIVVFFVIVVVVMNPPPSLVLILLAAKQSLPSTVVGLQSQNCLYAAWVACMHPLET